MKATNSFDEPGLTGAWTLLAHALMFNPLQVAGERYADASRVGPAPKQRIGWLERLDRWLWQLEQRGREAYLAQAKDIYELEERMRHLERSGPGRAL